MKKDTFIFMVFFSVFCISQLYCNNKQQAKVLDSPIVLYPNTCCTPVLFRVDWTDVPNATLYHLQIAGEPEFLSLTVNIYVNYSEFKLLVSLLIGSLYYLRVRAGNDMEWGPFCDPVPFNTILVDKDNSK